MVFSCTINASMGYIQKSLPKVFCLHHTCLSRCCFSSGSSYSRYFLQESTLYVLLMLSLDPGPFLMSLYKAMALPDPLRGCSHNYNPIGAVLLLGILVAYECGTHTSLFFKTHLAYCMRRLFCPHHQSCNFRMWAVCIEVCIVSYLDV